MISKFRRGSAVFSCQVCSRKTRDTGAQSYGNKICPQCYELAGIDNEISDGHRTYRGAKDQIGRYIAEIEAKGGNVAEWREIFARETDGE